MNNIHSLHSLMPKPIKLDLKVMNAISYTIEYMRTVQSQFLPSKYRELTSEFITHAPFIVFAGETNRSMLKPLVNFGIAVKQDPQFIPWVYITDAVDTWLPFVKSRYDGAFGDSIDKASESVELAINILPKLFAQHPDIKRRYYTFKELPCELAAWTVYTEELGYCTFTIRPSRIKSIDYSVKLGAFHLVPTQALLELGWRLSGGLIMELDKNKKEAYRDGKWIQKDDTAMG
ncbi:hypothetical protein [Pseudoalteromonas sp. SR45-4]|uniref:hypothetical protein n=1 Tax=Pseudoalteromonas sp. SR45-4 TaxID=2760929 RepID=UPI0015F91805|nr:hypothetical protein [Pseudoalteromonas sp. SR45-4]MBB1371378.1 hypothetical protein [Pseudoalteromonas sp. SR45-4]